MRLLILTEPVTFNEPVIWTFWFKGETEDGKKFTIFAEWNDWDDWTIDRIEFDESDGTDDEEEEITEEFLNDMN